MQLRSRVVAREFKSADRPDLYGRTPPLEALKAIISIAASHSPEFSLMHVDVSCAYFHAKAQRPVLVKLAAEDCRGKDQGKVGLLTKSMYGTRDAASNWERDGKGISKIGPRAGAECKKSVSQQEERFTHGDDFVVAGSKESLLELRKQLESVCPIKASIIGQVRQRASRH